MISNVDNIKILDNLEESWALKAINLEDIHMVTRGEGVKIVTIDSGADVNHNEIKDRVKSQFNMIDRNYDVTDELGHGTHVAGLLVGKNTGVAPEADLHVIKVLDKNGDGMMADVLDGITHAINIKADVLCISLGIKNDMPLIIKQRIVQAYEKGIAIVCSVGNDNSPKSRYPASMNEVIAVGGLFKDMSLAKFSNRGYDVLAPSVDIISSYKDGKYALMTGTSMASPIVAGAIALLISHYRKHNINLSVIEIMNILKKLDSKKLDLSKIIY